MSDYTYGEDQMRQCCTIGCVKMGDYYIILTRAKRKDTDVIDLMIEGYYCQQHMGEHLKALSRQFEDSGKP
jgi:hypothetical protein